MNDTLQKKKFQTSSQATLTMMTIFNGTYSWDGTKTDANDPISWFPGSCELSIIDFSQQDSGVSYLKPVLCVFTQSSHGHSISVNPDKFARKICSDFSLDMEKVLWAQMNGSDDSPCEILSFQKSIVVGEKTIYTVTRRPPLHGEKKLIKEGLAITAIS